jgi:hypothetical protein
MGTEDKLIVYTSYIFEGRNQQRPSQSQETTKQVGDSGCSILLFLYVTLAQQLILFPKLYFPNIEKYFRYTYYIVQSVPNPY